MSITLLCLVKGNTAANAFPVHIDKGQYVGALKMTIKAIKKNDFAGVDADNIKLWQVEIGGDHDEQLRNLSLKDSIELSGINEIGDYWTKKPPIKHIHVIITLPETTATSSHEQELLYRIASLEKDKELVYGKLKSSKRRHLGEEEQERSVKKIKQLSSPSSAALLNNFRKHQNNETFLIGRPYGCVGTPLVLYNSVFSDFMRDYNNKELLMNEENYQWTLEIIKLMADFYVIEDDREKVLHEQLRKLFGQEVTKVQLEDKYSNNGVLTLSFYTLNLLYLLIEIKNEIGTGGCDPTAQAAISYAKYYTQDKYDELIKGCNMPCFIIALAGPWICVLGAVYVERPVIEPLTAFEPLIYTSRTHVEKIARLFRALQLGSDNLKSYYRSLPYTTLSNVDSQRLYPYFRQAENVGEFFYTEKLFVDKLLWKAETKKDSQQIVVKYTHRYNKDAHELCYGIGKAPRLLHVEMKYGFYYVVMEYIEGKKLSECKLERSAYKKIIKDIEEAVTLLHSKDIVFADLRNNNILVIQDENGMYRGMLVDFDWAGVNDVDRYPTLMNPDINWPIEAKDNMPLKKEHDIYWLNLWKVVYLDGHD